MNAAMQQVSAEIKQTEENKPAPQNEKKPHHAAGKEVSCRVVWFCLGFGFGFVF